ncbi:MAG: magnesium transporter [Gaiellaceae bacterium]
MADPIDQNGDLGALVVSDVPRAASTELAGDVRGALLTRAFSSAGEIAVLEGERLVGVVPLETLLAADPGIPVSDLIEAEPAVVLEGTDREVAAARVAQHGGRALAVVDGEGRFKGLVPANQVIAILFEEHEEDMARLGGSLARTSAARMASEEAVPKRLWHRLPWLAVGLGGAMLSAAIVASFEGELQKQVLLAFFVPAVVYMADAVGTQTETVVIRGMSLGVPIGRIAVREILTGLIIGAFIAVTFFTFAVLIWHDTRVALVVSLALLVSTSTATAVAMSLPYLLARLGLDPAFGSGPLATVIQDLLSIAAYFAIAVVLLP